MHYTAVKSQEKSLIKDILLVVGASLALGIVGQIMIPLPFTPVPIALRSQLVLLFAVLLGPKGAALAVIGFIAQGLVGLPVFAMGAAGLGPLLGANGGYIVGYIAAALVTGYMAKRNVLGAMIAGTGVIYLFGASYLASFVGLQNALWMGVVPFLIGDALKIIANIYLLKCFRSV